MCTCVCVYMWVGVGGCASCFPLWESEHAAYAAYFLCVREKADLPKLHMLKPFNNICFCLNPLASASVQLLHRVTCLPRVLSVLPPGFSLSDALRAGCSKDMAVDAGGVHHLKKLRCSSVQLRPDCVIAPSSIVELQVSLTDAFF